MKIDDGTGSGRQAKVDNSNRLSTESVVLTQQREASINGDAFIINNLTPITLTTATESAVLYFKNNEDRDLIVSTVGIAMSDQTGATPEVLTLKVYKNPTSISAGTAIEARNDNFASSQALTADITVGQQGATFTGGSTFSNAFIRDSQAYETSTAITLPKGASIGFSIQPATGNTSVQIYLLVEVNLVRSS